MQHKETKKKSLGQTFSPGKLSAWKPCSQTGDNGFSRGQKLALVQAFPCPHAIDQSSTPVQGKLITLRAQTGWQAFKRCRSQPWGQVNIEKETSLFSMVLRPQNTLANVSGGQERATGEGERGLDVDRILLYFVKLQNITVNTFGVIHWIM